jgi:hypothetical protein
MTDKKDDTGKAAPRPGEGPRRPYATIDLQAKDVGAERGQRSAAGAAGAKADARAAATAALPPPDRKRPGAAAAQVALAALASGLRAVAAWSVRAARSNTFLSHVAAGVAGAVLTLAVGALAGLLAGDGGRLPPEASKRLAAVEQALDGRALAADVGAGLAAANERVASLEARVRTVAELADAQAKLAAETKDLEARIDAPALTQRIARLETALGALEAEDKSGRAERAEGLAAKLAEMDKLLGRRLEALKAEIDDRLKGVAKAQDLAPVLDKVAAFERDLQAFLKTEGDRVANARRVLLTLEIATLKRAMNRGDSYARELEAVRSLAGDRVDLRALDRYSRNGLPTPVALAKEFRRVANAAIDAESERADASPLDRLMAGARTVVRMRKTGHSPDDPSVEAVVGRMEAALKDGHIGEVLAQAGRLPPRAARAVEDWLRKVEARHGADRAVADIEAALKSSLAAPRPSATEPRQ